MIACKPAFLISGYVTDVLDDAKVYSGHAGKKTIDTEDVRLAVQCKMDHSFTTPPPRDVCKFVLILETLFRILKILNFHLPFICCCYVLR